MKLISAGCSFSTVNIDSNWTKTWPAFVAEYLGAEGVYLGTPSAGNGIIARRLLHELITISDTTEELLVGVMWSGPWRGESYSTNKLVLEDLGNYREQDGWQYNPIHIPPADKSSGWIIHNPHWQSAPARRFYRMFEEMQGHIQTYEWILFVQTFLESRNIKYFMATYTDQVLAKHTDPALAHYVKAIDWSKFVTMQGCYEWCKENTDIPFPLNDNHPNAEQHKIFTNEVIIPWLKSNNYVK